MTLSSVCHPFLPTQDFLTSSAESQNHSSHPTCPTQVTAIHTEMLSPEPNRTCSHVHQLYPNLPPPLLPYILTLKTKKENGVG